MADESNHDHESPPGESPATRGLGQKLHLIAMAVLVALIAALAIDNRQDVDIGWVAGDSSAPLALALVVAFLLGLGVGWLGARHQRR